MESARISVRGNTTLVELYYPRINGNTGAIEIDLVDVRASDGIRISYDFDRDGWVIKQPTKLEFEPNENPEDFWTEVAFCKSWVNNLDKKDE